MIESPHRRGLWVSILIVLAASLALPALYVVLARLGYPFGIRIVAMAEDYNWMLILSGQSAAAKAQNFWAMNDRNPLSPWWYIVADRLYRGPPNGPYLTRLLMQPLLGLSAFAMVRNVTAGRANALALGVGMLAGGSLYGGSIDQIHWNFLGALSLSMLSVACFAAWINSGRRQVAWYGASLVLWYCAFASYTFQVGAVLSIAVLACLSSPPAATRVRSAFAAALEILPFVILLAAFLLAWKTTQNPAMASYYQLQPELLLKNLPASLLVGIWPQRYAAFAWVAWTQLAWLLPVLCLLFGTAAALAHALMRSAVSVSASDALRVLLISFGLVLPTAMIESMSPIWSVGIRWPMVDQGWQPLFWLSLIACMLALSPASEKVRRYVLSATVGVAVALAVGASLGYNNVQVSRSVTESALRNGLTDAARTIPVERAVNFLVIVKPGVDLAVPDMMSGRTALVWFPGRDIGLRILTRGAEPLEPGHRAWWKVKFGPDRAENVRIGGGVADYEALRMFRFDGRSVTPIVELDEADVAGYPVSWQRTTPLRLPSGENP